MKFSVLLPTRNRLELLRLAIESVRTQDYSDWELLVSDNASDDDIASEVVKIGDSRIVVRRFDNLVPVTENWNATLEMATGDYLIMLGDDDALLPGVLSKLKELIEAWAGPDAVYAQAHQYAYPNVVPGHEKPFVQTGYNAFLEGTTDAFRLPSVTAHQMAHAAMAFRILYGFNMQHFIFSRLLVDRVKPKGPFFQSPFPDYYAANAILLSAETIVATPHPVCLIGISPKSFGFYYVNSQEREGVEFLHNTPFDDIATSLSKEMVPGSNMNDSWLCAMETLKRNFPEAGGRVSYARYRRLQYHEILLSGGRRRYLTLLLLMRPWEIVAFGFVAAVYLVARTLPGGVFRRVRSSISHSMFSRSPRFDPKRRVVPFRDILEAARAHAG